MLSLCKLFITLDSYLDYLKREKKVNDRQRKEEDKAKMGFKM